MLKYLMRNRALPLVFALFILLAAVPAVAEELGGKPTDVIDVNGQVWMESNPETKLSFLLGVESAIAMDHALTSKQAERAGKEPVYSPFQKGWIQAFEGTTRAQLAYNIDKYYQDHPDQGNRHVFDIIWTEMIIPVTSGREI